MMPDIRTVALLTDFGTSDSYVAEMKAVMLSIHRDLRFIDITHDVGPGDIRQAQVSFCCTRQRRAVDGHA
jgi:S-adenosylmethionine hydrolase